MHAPARVALALVAALALHLLARALIDGATMRARPVPAQVSRPAVELALWTARPPPPPVEEEQARPASTPAPRHHDVAPLIDEAPPPAPPLVDAPPPPSAAPLPMAPPPAPRPRSLLERVLAGASTAPAPSLELLDPSRRAAPPTDAERARQQIQALARAASARGAPAVDAGSLVEQLEALEGGGYRYVTGGFVATIQVDGSVSFVDTDHREGLFSSALPGRDPTNVFEPYGPTIQLFTRIDGAPVPRVMGIPVADEAATLGSASFDPTAALIRATGQDPYAPEKACFLQDTLSLRADLRAAHERAQMAGLRLHLERLWFDDSRPAAERRAALFAAWDECREEEVGALARELIVSFIRQHLPAGSADAFTADELRALNARRTSTAPFAPYG